LPVAVPDIDLAVEKLKGRAYWKAICSLSNATAFNVDLVCLEDCSERLRNVIISEGVLLHGKNA
jgi:predicted nucleotidyltransferase